jgi:pheromone shutdown protein TraB
MLHTVLLLNIYAVTYFKSLFLLRSIKIYLLFVSIFMQFRKQAFILIWFPYFFIMCVSWSIIMNRHLAGHMLTIGTTHGSSYMCTGYAPLLGPCLLGGSSERCSYHCHLSPRPRKHDQVQSWIQI